MQSKVYNVQKTIHQSAYSLYGLASIWQSTPGVLAFNSAMTNDFYLRVDSLRPIQQFFFSYIILGVGSASVCGTCNDKFIYNQQCSNACPPNSYQVNYNDGGRGCR